MRLITAILLAWAASVGRVDALTFNFSGFITSVTPGSPNLPQVVVGTAFTGTITVVDGFAPADSDPNPNTGRYDDPASISGKPLRYGITLASGLSFLDYSPINSIITTADLPGGDRLSIFGETFSGLGILSFTFFDSTGRALSSDAWTTAYDSPYWESITVEFNPLFPGTSFVGTAVIPESAATILLLIIAVSALLVCGRILSRAARDLNRH